MSCHRLTLDDLARTLDVLGVVVCHVRGGAGVWHAELATDDGHTVERADPLLGEALQQAVSAVVKLRREQRTKGAA